MTGFWHPSDEATCVCRLAIRAKGLTRSTREYLGCCRFRLTALRRRRARAGASRISSYLSVLWAHICSWGAIWPCRAGKLVKRPAVPPEFVGTREAGRSCSVPCRSRGRCCCVRCSSPCLRRQLLPLSSALGQRHPRSALWPRCARPRRRCSWAEPQGRLPTR